MLVGGALVLAAMYAIEQSGRGPTPAGPLAPNAVFAVWRGAGTGLELAEHLGDHESQLE